MFSRSGMHPAIDQVLGLVLVRAISSKDSTIRQVQNTCICALISGQRLRYTFGESCAHRRFQARAYPGNARVKIRVILVTVITYKLWGSSCTVPGCMLAVSTTRPYLMYTTNAHAYNRKQSTKVLRELIQMTMITEKLKNFPRFARYR